MDLSVHGCTYFIANPEGKIKIGFTYYMPRRFGELQKQYDADLTLMAIVMSSFAEYDLHKRFAHLRAEDSEWFRPEGELMDYIRGLNCTAIRMEEVKRFWNCVQNISDGINYCSYCGGSSSSHIVYVDFYDKERKFPKEGVGFCSSCYRIILERPDLEFIDFKDRNLPWINPARYAPDKTFSFDKSFGKIVKIMLAAHNLSQEDLAKKTGINPGIISRICTGRRSPRKYMRKIKTTLHWTDRTEDACRTLLEEIESAQPSDA